MRESEIQQWDYPDRPCNYKEWPTVATPIVTTPLRNAMPRKPGPAGPTLDWRKITDVFKEPAKTSSCCAHCKRPDDGLVMGWHSCPCHDDEPKEFPTVVGPLRFAPDDVDIRSNEVVRREAQYAAYHEIGNHPEKPKPSRNYMDFVGFDRHLMDEVVKAFGITSAELGKPEKDLEDTKHTNDVLGLLRAGAISPNQARYHLGLPEPLQVIKEPKAEKHYVYAAGHGFIEATAIPPGNTVNEVRKNAIEAACNALRESSGGKEPIVTIRDDGWRVTSPDRYIEHFDEAKQISVDDLERLCKTKWNNTYAKPVLEFAGPPSNTRDVAAYHGYDDDGNVKPHGWGMLAKLCKCTECTTYLNSLNTKENPMSISTNPVTDLADRARELAKDGKVSLDSVKSAIDQGKAERKERIEGMLKGVADLEALKGAQGKQFVLVHFCRDQHRTVHGIAYPGYDASEKEAEELKVETVKLQADADPLVYNSYETMRELRVHLDNHGIPYVIKFYE